MRSRFPRLLVRALVTLAAFYAVVLALVWWQQERLLFHPTALAADHRFEFGADVHEVTLDVPGAQLSALHLEQPNARGVVLFLHGNAGNLDGWFTNAELYRRAGFDLFMIDYRGFGKSTGSIADEAQLRADVRAAWDWIAQRYPGKPRVIHGRSLGTALAAGLAAEVDPELTVLVSPYRSIEAMSRTHYPFVPTVLLRYPLRTEDDAARVDGPLLLVHGEADTLIPISHSEAILARAPHAQLLRIAGAGHDDVHAFEAYRVAMTAALAAL